MESVTVHGLPRIFSEKGLFAKIVWVVVFLCSCFIFGRIFHVRLQTFNLRQVILRIERHESPSLSLPGLTFCDTDLRSDTQSLQSTKFPDSCDGPVNATSLFRYGCRLFMSAVNYSCTYHVGFSCRFPRNFIPASNWKRCFTFNRYGAVAQYTIGQFNGVDFLMYKNSSVVYDKVNTITPFKDSNQGLKLQVHPPHILANQLQDNPISLIPGYKIHVSVKKKVYIRLPAPYPSKCSEKTSVKQLVGGPYTRVNCRFSCFLQRAYDKCGGVLWEYRPLMPLSEYPYTKKFKDLRTLYFCVVGLYATTAFANCDCPIPCREEVYETRVSQQPWQKTSIIESLHPQIAKLFGVPADEVNLESWKENIVFLRIFYEDFTVEHIIEEELYGVWSLLSDFGGLIGLFIGASAISVLEVIWVFLYSFSERFKKRKVNDAETEKEEKKSDQIIPIKEFCL